MRVLVTGGAGFIGSHVVDALVAAGHEVRVLDRLLPAVHAGPPAYVNPSAGYEWGGVEDAQTVRRCIQDVDAVSHQAAMVGLGAGVSDILDYVRHNDLGTATLLHAMAQTHFQGRLVLASSMAVYGEGRYHCPEHGVMETGQRHEDLLRAGRFDPTCSRCGKTLVPEPVPESARPDPRNVYAATKLHQEHLCGVLARETGLPFAALRYHNVYGSRMPRDTPYAGVASIFRSALERGEPPQVLEDGGQLRDFVNVRDVARANLLALTVDPPPSGAFNVAGGEPRTVGEMAEALAQAFAPDAPRPEITGRYRFGDVRHIFASPHLAEEVLGFRAGVRFADGMQEFSRAAMREPAEDRVER